MRPQEEFGLSVSDDHDLSRSEGLGLLAAKPKATRDAQAVDAKKILSGVWRKPGRNSGRASAQVRGSERVRPARALWGITSPTASDDPLRRPILAASSREACRALAAISQRPLSRRKQGFESPRERQSLNVSNPCATVRQLVRHSERARQKADAHTEGRAPLSVLHRRRCVEA